MKLKEFFTKPCVLIIVSAILSALPLTFSQLFFISWVSFIPLCIYYWFLWFYPLDFAGLSGSASIAVVLLAAVGISAVHGALWCIPFIMCYT